MMDKFIALMHPDAKRMDEINYYRSQASELYDVTKIDKPVFIQSSDGTGFGKSYGVLKKYIESIDPKANHKNGFNNMCFITPQKAQFEFDQSLIKEAHQKGIEFVSFLAQKDMTDLDFESWVVDPSNKKIKNDKRYKNWIDQKKKCDKALERELSRLKQSINGVRSLKYRIEQEKKNPDADSFDDLEKQLDMQFWHMHKVLSKLGLAALNGNDHPIKLHDMLKATKGIDALRKEIISHCFPFLIAMIKPCVLLATTHKFDQKIALPVINKNKIYTVKFYPFDFILGGKIYPKENNTGDFASKPHTEQIKFLKEDFFTIDEKNEFRKKNITFTLVLDEVHNAYNIFSDSANVSLITPEIQLAHVFAGIYRIYQQVMGMDDNEEQEAPFYTEKREFISNIESNLKKECELSANQNLKSILNIFIGNVDFIQIKRGDVEQVINLTRNAFCFTPKLYFNEQGLKKVRLKVVYGQGSCQLYHTVEKDKNPSLYDIYQVTMSVLGAAAKIKSGSEFLKSLGQNNDNSQNYPLYKFITRARSVASEIEYMFERGSKDEKLIIDHFFTYFQSKTVFSIRQQKQLEFKDTSLENLTYINFTLDLIKEQPEVSLLRILYNTKNSVIALSATSGISGNILGQYNHGFLKKYCSGTGDNLAINILSRSNDNAAILKGLRESRAKLRDVKFTVFPEESAFFNQQKSSVFKKEFKYWYNLLRQYADYLQDKYKIIEFKRQLTALLLTAYDSKNTLSLALSGKFILALGKYVRAIDNKEEMKPLGFEIIEKKGRIFKIKPFKDKPSIKVILFNASLNKEYDVRKEVLINDLSLKIAFISTYGGAGTGLNYFIRYPSSSKRMGKSEFEIDFERLVLINSPFWSRIIKDEKSEERTLYSLGNCLSLMKRISDSRELKKLEDFSINLVHGSDYRFLMREHNLELLKIVMQAIGRVERKDANMTTEIYLSDDVFNNASMQFSKLQRDNANFSMRESMSLLNYRFMQYCEKESKKTGFKNKQEREKFEQKIRENGKMLTEFFDDFVAKNILGLAREGNQDAIRFNEALRHIDSIKNPDAYVKRLKSNKLIQDDLYIKQTIDCLYIKLLGKRKSLILCRRDNDPHILTDILHGDSLYQPKKTIVPDYSGKKVSDLVRRMIRESKALAEQAFISEVPHPKFIPVLKGNMGEYLFDQLLRKLKIKPIAPNKIAKVIASQAYELFDSYIEVEKQLVCIDVKNWSSLLDKKDISKNSYKKALRKIKTIHHYVDGKYESIHFVYINTRIENNPLNYKQELDSINKIYYLNLFKEEIGYKEKIKNKETSEKKYKTKKIAGSELKSEISINQNLLALLG